MKKNLSLFWPALLKSVLALFIMLSSFQVFATHFRYANITWNRDAVNPLKIHFTVTEAWRRGFAWNTYFAGNPVPPNVGNTINFGGNFPLNFGDASSANIVLTVTSISVAEDWVYGVFVVDHTYSSPGNFLAFFEGAARISGPPATPAGPLQNNGDGSFRVETRVTVGNNNDAPVSTLPPFINLPVGNPAASYIIPATDPDGDAILFTLAPPTSFTQTSTALNTQPVGFSVSPTGTITFSTVGKTIGHFYNAVVRLTDSKGAYNHLDFLIRIVGPSNPPIYDPPTPPDNFTYNVAPGTLVNYTVKAHDPDPADNVTLFVNGKPIGATLTPGLPTSGPVGGPVQTNFSWTPTLSDIGSYVTTYIAQDPQGIQTPTTVKINVACTSTITCRDVTIHLGPSPVIITPTGPATGQLPPQTKGITAFCPAPATPVNTCNCPTGYVAVGYSGDVGSFYGGTVSRFRLNCRAVNPDGTFGAATSVTCDNGTAVGLAPASQIAAPNQALVGFQNYIGCAIDQLNGRSKPLAAILAVTPNAINNAVPPIGNIGGALQPTQLAPDGYVIVGMRTYVDVAPGPANGNSAGYAWNYAKLEDVMKGIATVTSDCGIASVVLSKSSFDCSDLGVNSVIVTATDVAGNNLPCTFTVTVIDDEAPVITCPPNTTVNNDPGVCGATVTQKVLQYNPTGPQASVAPVPVFFAAPGVSASGLSQVGYSPFGNNNVWPVGYISSSPTIVAGEYVTFNASFPAGTDLANLAYDKYSYFANGPTQASIRSSLDGFSADISTIAVNPAAGQTLKFDLSSLPTLAGNVAFRIYFWGAPAAPNDWADLVSTAAGGNGLVVNAFIGATATDNCGSPTITYDVDPSQPFPVGTTVVNATAKDGPGNTSTCTFSVTVIDNENPVITCPFAGNQNRNTNLAVCTWKSPNNALNATATDNCSATVSYTLSGATAGTGPSLNGVIFNKGVTNVVWKAVDPAGNSATCGFTVTVVDNQPPVITCPLAGNTNRNTDPGLCTWKSPNTSLDATATDNCAVTSLTYLLSGATAGTGTTLNGVIFNKGVTTVKWTASDGVPLNASCSFTVTVIDNQDPTIGCPTVASSYTVNNIGCTYKASGSEFDPTFADNCPGATIKNDFNNSNTLNGAAFPKGTTTVIWTVTDAAGRTATCTIVVKVVTSLAATIPDVYAVNPGGQPNTIYIGYGPSSLTLTATPSGGSPGYTYSWSPGGATTQSITVSPVVTTTYTVTVTDSKGCKTTASKTIIVVDVRCGNKNDKVTVCQVPPGNPGNAHTICISPNAVATHLANGSYLGNCTNGNRTVKPEVIVTTTDGMNVYPNPNNGLFDVQLTGVKPSKATIVILNGNGSILEKRAIEINSKKQLLSFDMSRYASGLYYIQLITPDGIKSDKVTIQR
jgi:hypothetical protein